jgi:hypothetical protein
MVVVFTTTYAISAYQWFSLGTPVTSTNKTEILLKLVLKYHDRLKEEN